MMHGNDSVKTYAAPGADSVNLQPDTDEVLQAEPQYSVSTIPVCVEEIKGPVRTQTLPRKGGSTRTRTVDSDTPWWALRADHYRGVAKLVSFDQDMLIAFSEASAQSDETMSRWPKTVPFQCEATVDLWVKAYTTDGTTTTTAVSVTTERWAEGK